MAVTAPQAQDDGLYAEVTIACLFCVETGREYLTLGLTKCKHCGGTRKRTIKRRLTAREMAILVRAFDDGEDAVDDSGGEGA